VIVGTECSRFGAWLSRVVVKVLVVFFMFRGCESVQFTEGAS